MSLDTLTRLASVLGALSFLTSAIVQAIKEQPGFRECPTSLIALVASEIVTVVALLTYCAQTRTFVQWYYVTSAIVVGFLVYLIATGGWDKLTSIWQKTQFKGEK